MASPSTHPSSTATLSDLGGTVHRRPSAHQQCVEDSKTRSHVDALSDAVFAASFRDATPFVSALVESHATDPVASAMLGLAHDWGLGARVDLAVSHRWYQSVDVVKLDELARQGNAHARYHLGRMIHLGKGTAVRDLHLESMLGVVVYYFGLGMVTRPFAWLNSASLSLISWALVGAVGVPALALFPGSSAMKHAMEYLTAGGTGGVLDTAVRVIGCIGIAVAGLYIATVALFLHLKSSCAKFW